MARLDVRLDDERRARLDELAKERGVPISELVRRFIDDAYEDVMLQRRREALRQLVKLNIEVPEDPAELSRELEAAYEPGSNTRRGRKGHQLMTCKHCGKEYRYTLFGMIHQMECPTKVYKLLRTFSERIGL